MTIIRSKKPDPITGFYTYRRKPRNMKERFLKWRGWEPAGLSLLIDPYNNHASMKNLNDAWKTEIAHLRRVFRLDKD
jgi:hypothetical protein